MKTYCRDTVFKIWVSLDLTLAEVFFIIIEISFRTLVLFDGSFLFSL